MSNTVAINSDKITKLELNYELTDEFDLSHVPELTHLTVKDCKDLKHLNFSQVSLLTHLHISKCYALEKLDLSPCINLTYLYIEYSGVISLNLSQSINLKSIDLLGLSLYMLDLSNVPALYELSIGYCNRLTDVDLTKCVNLTELFVEECQMFITTKLTKLTKLKSVKIYNAMVTMDC